MAYCILTWYNYGPETINGAKSAMQRIKCIKLKFMILASPRPPTLEKGIRPMNRPIPIPVSPEFLIQL